MKKRIQMITHNTIKRALQIAATLLKSKYCPTLLLITFVALTINSNAEAKPANPDGASDSTTAAKTPSEKKDSISIVITNPNKGEKLQPESEVMVRWILNGNGDFNRSADLFFSSECSENWKKIQPIDLASGEYKWTVPDTKHSECCQFKIVVKGKDKKETEFKSARFTVGESEYYEDKISVATGVNFNYAADNKFDGLYFGINASLPKILKIWKPVGVDLYFAQGKIVSNRNETQVPDTIYRYSSSTNIKDQLVYSAASIYFNFKNFQWIIIHSEFNRTSRTYDVSTYSSRKTVVNDTLRVISDTTFSKGENFPRKNEFLLGVGTGLGFKFYNDEYYIDVKALPLLFNFNSDKLINYVARFRVGTNGKKARITVGGNIKGPYGLGDQPITSLRNGRAITIADEYDQPSVLVPTVQVFIYASIDVELNSVIDIFSGKK